MILGIYTDIRNRIFELRNESGASAVEYGLLVALIAVVIILAVTALGTNLKTVFETIAKAVGAAGGSGSEG